jgi:glutaredoxin
MTLNTDPRHSDELSPSVVLYTRQGCHLCDDALAVLERHGIRPKCVDVDADPQLRDQFNECVPVVEVDGKIRFRGRVEETLLRRLLRSGT